VSFLKAFQVNPARIPLRWLLVVPFVLLTTGATGLVGYLSYRSGQQAVENLANQLLRQTSERVNDRLDSYLQLPQQIVATNQFAIQQRTLNLANQEQLQQQLWQQIILNPSLPTSEFWSESGSATGYFRFNTEEARQQAEKVAGQTIPAGAVLLNETQPNLRQYFWTDSQGKRGKRIYQRNSDFRTSPWYRHAKSMGKQSWTPISVAPVIPLLQIQAFAPVYDSAGRLQGVFASNYMLSRISRFLNQLQFSPKGQIFIMERSGDLVATSIKAEAAGMQQVNGKPTRLPAINSSDDRTRQIAQQLINPLGRSDDFATLRQLTLNVRDERQFIQVAPYQDRYGLDWLVVTVIPESDFLREIMAQNARTLLLCFGTLAATIAIGVWVARRITNPLQQLSLAADRIAQREFDQPIPRGGVGEVQQLSQAFQQMAQELQLSFQLRSNYEQELRQRVVERTAELAQAKELREAIFNESTDAIFLVEAASSSRILDCNEQAVALFEVGSKAELIGIRGSTLQKQPYTEAELAEIAAELEQKGFWSREIEYVTKTGRLFWGNLAVKPISIAGQAMQLVRLTDISDRIQAEHERQQTEAALRQSEIRSSVLEERNRMAREIHDTLAQALTSILVHLEVTARKLDSDTTTAQACLQTCKELANSGLAEARRSVAALRLPSLEQETLYDALCLLAQRTFAHRSTQVIHRLSGEPYRLPETIANHLLRIGQEALMNVFKHANASEVQIELSYEPEQCILRVKDNGAGFESTTTAANHFGLVGMMERAEAIGAELTVCSQPGQGTEVIASVHREGLSGAVE